MRAGEDLQTLMAQTPEDILLRWVNHHLEKEGVERRATNLGADLKDRCVRVFGARTSTSVAMVESCKSICLQ